MPNIPITGDALYDFVLVLAMIIIGAGLALKADKPWGWALIVLAVVWAYVLARPLLGS